MTAETGKPLFPGGLSARLLVLTVVFVMLSVVLIFVPSVSRFRLGYLEDHIDAAQLAISALEVTPDNMVSKELTNELLDHVGAHGIVVHTPDRTLMLSPDMPPSVDATYDLRSQGMLAMIGDAMMTLSMHGNRVLRVLGVAPKDPSVTVEVLLDEQPMRAEMWEFGARVLEVSLVVSLITGALVYLTLQWLLVAPLKRLTASMVAFRKDPEDAAHAETPGGRGDEIGLAQRELAAMQETVRQALKQKERLAALGAAVNKINHDLRGILSTVRLMSDRLSESDSPEVKRVTPGLIAAIDRAVALCTGTLNFTRQDGAKLNPSFFALRGLIAEIGENVAPAANGNGFKLVNEVPEDFTVQADRDQLFRALENLTRNAAEAGARRCLFRARRAGKGAVIEVSDDGPGLAPKARENLFRPFAGSARPGGTGLGLAIAREVMRAHGGDIQLKSSTGTGTVFALTLP